MSARDEFMPLQSDLGIIEIESDKYGRMCDEIDRLRGCYDQWLMAEQAINDKEAVIRSLDELISTLTTHADAMRDLLRRAYETIENDHWPLARVIDQAIATYDEFVKEC